MSPKVQTLTSLAKHLQIGFMAEGILSDIVEAILLELGSLALDEIQISLSFQDDLKKLSNTLSTIKAVLLDAEQQKHVKSHAVQDWLRKLKGALHDAQDLFDDLSAEIMRQRMEPELAIVTEVRNFFFRREMGHRVKAIRDNLDEIAKNRKNFHFSECVDTMPFRHREETYSFVNFTEFIGREDDKHAVVEFTLGYNENDLCVIPIVGIGGLGKTTLAQFVFNDDEVKSYFDLRIWISLSDDLSAKKVVEKMVKAASGIECAHLDMEHLYPGLLELLKGNKFLLVIDDVWDGNQVEWVKLKGLLTNDSKGSKVLMTTRNKSVALSMGTIDPYFLAYLPEHDCWTLFEKWAFREGETTRDPNLVKIGEEILKKCGGVPLAIRTLGSLLHLKTEESYWLSMRDNEIWNIDQMENDILPVLRLSYDQLPSPLKKCFAYCSLLPKDQDFDKETVIQLWMAQGFIQSSNQIQNLEDIGSFYFDELVSRSFFDIVHENYKAEIVKCRMHDLMHDLAMSVAGAECLRVNLASAANVFERVRHVSFCDFYLAENSAGVMLSPKASDFRTLIFPIRQGNHAETSFLGALHSISPYLRVLDLSFSDIRSLPNSIGDLKHLRYLNLNGNHRLQYLPDSICKLYFLQTLKLLGCLQIVSFPAKFGNLVSLRHLIVNSPNIRAWEKQVGSLNSLQSLTIMHCDHLVSFSEGMQHLGALRTLRIHNCGKLVSLFGSMKSNTSLENLEILNCSKLRLHGECMEGLSGLRSLTIKGLPQLLTLPHGLEVCASTLQYLYIMDCLNLMALPDFLGKFMSLKRLYISFCPYLQSLPDGLQRLKYLQVFQMDGCPLLSSRCQRRIGQDWPKISHVPIVRVNTAKF